MIGEKYGFSLGDRVVMVGYDPTGTVRIGQIGIICDFDKKYSDGCDVGVEWEIGNYAYHDCYGKCKNRYGRYVPHTSISLTDIDLGKIESSDMPIGALFDITS